MEIKVRVPQGIGDIFWLYQKLAPYSTEINFNIMLTEYNKPQQRAVEFVKLLPNVQSVQMVKVTHKFYQETIRTTLPVQNILQRPMDDLGYSVNAALETGKRLEMIDPDSQIAWRVGFKIPKTRAIHGDYLAVYVSGSRHKNVWKPRGWAKLTKHVRSSLDDGNLPVVLLGASYDEAVINRVQFLLQESGVPSTVYIDKPAEMALRIIRDARFFIGYQSGLSILADNYNVPQVIVYFDKYADLKYSWCQMDHIRKKFFAYTFGESVPKICESFAQEWAALHNVVSGVRQVCADGIGDSEAIVSSSVARAYQDGVQLHGVTGSDVRTFVSDQKRLSWIEIVSELRSLD